VILIDARKGVLTQTRRHSYLVKLLGIRHVVLAVNKMDLVGWDQAVFDRIVADYRAFAEQIGLTVFTPIPISGLGGDNMASRSDDSPWFEGPILMDWLEGVEVEDDLQSKPFRMPVQWVNRPEPRLPGLFGPDRLRHGQAGRPHPRPALGPREHRRPHRHLAGDLTRPSPASR
jgi:bifunctional enzyme CysN/CysC